MRTLATATPTIKTQAQTTAAPNRSAMADPTAARNASRSTATGTGPACRAAQRRGVLGQERLHVAIEPSAQGRVRVRRPIAPAGVRGGGHRGLPGQERRHVHAGALFVRRFEQRLHAEAQQAATTLLGND
jgi:hypothetical protein